MLELNFLSFNKLGLKLMRVICAWCQKVLREEDPSSIDQHPISHGICSDCLKTALSFKAKDLHTFLNQFAAPVFNIDSEGRVITANNDAFSLIGKSANNVEGLLGGDVFECRYARLPEGCGKTVHCKTCTIRNTVMDTLQSGQSQVRVPAYPDLHHITDDKQVRFLISTERMGNTVLLRIDEITEEEKV